MEFYKTSLSVKLKIALLSAIGFILMFLNISLIIFPSFLKIDISDLPEVIALLQFGLFHGILVALIKNILHLFVTQSMGIGELMNFIMAALFLVPLNFFVLKAKNLKTSFLIAIICISILSIPVNKYIMFPLYQLILHINPENIVNWASKTNPLIKNLNLYLSLVIMPFNFLKFLLVCMLSYMFERYFKN